MSSREKELAIKIAARMDKTFSSTINQANSKLQGLGSIAKKAAGIVTGAFAAIKIKDFISDSVSTYADFDQAMAQTAATAGASQTDYKLMEEAALAAGKATTKTATEAAQALGYMSLAGWNTQQSVKGLTPILRTAEATQMDLATCSDLVTDSLSALGLSVDDLNHYLDVSIQANNKSNQTASQMMEAFISAGLTLDDLGDSIENVSGLYGMLANRGTKASEAGTAMKAITVNVKNNADAIEKLGVSVYDAEGKFRGISNVLYDYNNATKNMSQEQKDALNLTIAGKNHLGSFNKIMEGFNTTLDDGTTEWETLTKALNNSEGALDTMACKVTDTLSGAMARFNSAIDDVKINLVKQFAPYATKAINKISELIPKLTEKASYLITYANANISPTLERIGNGIDFLKNTGINSFNIIKSKVEDNKSTFDKFIEVVSSVKDKLYSAFETSKPTIIYISETVLPQFIDGMIEVLDSATDVYNFINDNWTLIGPIATGIGIAIAGIKMAKFAIEVATATKAMTLLRIAKLKDKVETIILQGLYAKDAIVKAASTAATYAQTAAMTAWNVVCGVGATVTTALGAAFAFLTSPIGLVIIAITAVIAAGVWLYKHWEEVKQKALDIWNSICEIFNGVKASVETTMNSLAEKFPTTFAVIQGYFAIWKQEIQIVITAIKGIFDGIVQFISGVFTGNWSQAWQGVVNVFSSIFGAIADIAKIPINGLITLVNSLTSKLSSIKINVPDWVPGIGGKTFGMSIPEIPHLASGGIATKSTIAEIGEGSEPEAVLPLSKLSMMLENEASQKNCNAQQSLQQPQIIYSPNYNFYGGTPTKEDIAGAEQITQSKFNKMMEEWQRQNKRTSFS